ncbi:TetR/AcrR family transcriptional regulator C-terminal ligand-binding domain-containing protein [Amycolatopsis cynarae]|uniref:TetR/AcrR family transcriptional regulator C-terminal ligand-binding domain-containing protein n=1 Tax=Amycolatopsis cynarae TaxID=2995223 RepID=A0ABY7ATZ3_9PSEU|nr:TetR/AcrR family transcriptional regulator C-terminal ligand-binding domain-containing protein [Amycolatopsis sp. HUAS 11-8]WAL63381.1 TetR/AcrR family transcriptional regulator C-terminal ligand-binding domain-containing protein [Amycolatopsis sp. HUAS 11-8]
MRDTGCRAAARHRHRRRYFDEIIAPCRAAVYRILRRGIAAGEIRPDIEFVGELLVAPILARAGTGRAW